MTKNPPGFYAYVLLDPRKPGLFLYEDARFDFEPFYVGKGKGGRLRRHLTTRRQYHVAYKTRRIREETGKSAIAVCYQSGLSEDKAFELEIALIALIGRADRGAGPLVNKCDGGQGVTRPIVTETKRQAIARKLVGRTQTIEVRARRALAMKGHVIAEETKLKISKANKGRVRKRGWHHSEETCQKMRKPKSLEAIANMTAARQKRNGSMSAEVRAKISAKLKGRPIPEETKAKMRGRIPWNKRVVEARV